MLDLFEYLKTLSKMRQRQLRQAVFVDLVSDTEEVTTFSKNDRTIMAKEFELLPFQIEKELKSNDGSTKFLLKTVDNNYIETVLLSFKDGRNTVCVSSQVGCPAKCAFCATGQNGFKRNLTSWEIISQVLVVSRKLKLEDKKVTNIVFMGMGEPMLNLDAVVFAIGELMSPEGFGLGARHITISTFGPIPALKKFIALNTRTRLAISLHAPNEILREKLMPATKANLLSDLMAVLDQFVSETNKRVSYEYIMLHNINDSDDCARQLCNLLRGRLSHVNLISYNSVKGSNFRPSDPERVRAFSKILSDFGITVTTRVSLGGNIDGACGQLAGKNSNTL